MRGYRKFTYISALIVAILIAVACTKKGVVKKAGPVITPPSAEASTTTPATKTQKVSKAVSGKKQTAQKPMVIAKAAPSKKKAAARKKATRKKVAKKAEKAKKAGVETSKIPEKYKNIDPSLLIYLSSRGVLAGTGDPTGYADPAYKVGHAKHPAALELSRLPKDKFGLVDWAAAIKKGLIKPRDSLDPNAVPTPPLNLDIVIHTKSKFMPDVVFPHYTHTLWLTCTNCHTKIFKMKAGGNPEMTMTKIAAGEYCGRCHNRVAFPLADCNRCHVKPKESVSK